MSELHRAAPRHGHGERFLDLMLGAKVWCERLDALLARDARTDEPVDPDAVDVMLGLIAIRARFSELFESARPVTSELPPSTAMQDSLLR